MMARIEDKSLRIEAASEEPADYQTILEELKEGTLQRLSELAEDLGDYSSELAALMRRLPEILEKQSTARQYLVLCVFGIAFDAFDDDQDDSGCFLIQVGIIMAAGHEDSAERCLRKIAGSARAELKLPRN